MRRGFTILELLVASLLLGMLTTILTMIFNQSAIAWRTGSAMVADLDEVRDNIATLREEADNAFVWDGKVRRLVSVWNSHGDENNVLNDRACDAEDSDVYKGTYERREKQNRATMLDLTKGGMLASENAAAWSTGQNVVLVGQGDSGNSAKTYTVNVMSAGPDREFDTWDDIWSFPDDFD